MAPALTHTDGATAHDGCTTFSLYLLHTCCASLKLPGTIIGPCCKYRVYIQGLGCIVRVINPKNCFTGAMPCLVAMLEVSRSLGKAAYRVLTHLLSPTIDSSQTALLFAQLKGARRLSNLLCPWLLPGEASSRHAQAGVPCHHLSQDCCDLCAVCIRYAECGIKTAWCTLLSAFDPASKATRCLLECLDELRVDSACSFIDVNTWRLTSQPSNDARVQLTSTSLNKVYAGMQMLLARCARYSTTLQ